MQKNRNAVAAGILALALLVGGIALYSNQKAQKAPETTAMENVDEPSAPVTATPDELDTTDTPAMGENTDGTTTTTTDKAGDKSSTSTTTNTIPETYTVKNGDTLRDIAKRFYGDPIYSADIERVNEIENANHVPAGKVLKMPRRDDLNNNTPATAPQTEKSGDKADTTPTN